MNPVPVLLWFGGAALIALVPRFVLGWSWLSAFVTGLVATPPGLWLLATLLDRHERAGAAAPPRPRPPLILDAAPPCPECGACASATILYGQQGQSKELLDAIQKGRIVLAGCPVYAGAPLFLCASCGMRHGRLELGSADTAVTRAPQGR